MFAVWMASSMPVRTVRNCSVRTVSPDRSASSSARQSAVWAAETDFGTENVRS